MYMYVLLVELLTKSFCIDFLVLVVSYILPFVNFDYSTYEQQSTHFYNHRLYLVFKKTKIRFFCLSVMCNIFPFSYMSRIHYNGTVFILHNRWFYFVLFFAIAYDFCLIFYKFTLSGRGYRCFVCTVAAFVCNFFAHCYHFDTRLFYININVI